jgi:5-methyltetrahydrofolate--homocysteine methyltransferase
MTIINDVFNAVLEGDQAGTDRLVAQALAAGVSAETVLNDGMIAAMAVVGRRFESGEYFIPDMLVSARAMQAGMTRLRPLLVAGEVKPIGTVVVGTVHGDLHDIGKNLVAVMLEGAGFHVIDLGVDVPAEKYVQCVKESGANLVALSALLTTTMGNMHGVIKALKAAGLGDQVKVIVGGAPITQEFASHIGADGFAPDAAGASNLACALVGV